MVSGDQESTKIAEQILDRQGKVWRGAFQVTHGTISTDMSPVSAVELTAGQDYFVEALPVDFHCHGVGRFDFSDISSLDLIEIEKYLSAAGLDCIVTLSVSEQAFPLLLATLAQFREERGRGFRRIAGLALEGPLISSIGGTPAAGAWLPTRNQWRELASCGASALRYVVLSPDANVRVGGTGSPVLRGQRVATPEEAIEILIEAGIAPAFGHFSRVDPNGSAAAILRALDCVQRVNARTGSQTPVVSDHLLNDMPIRIRYAWRTTDQRVSRQREIEELRLESWRLDSLGDVLGPVPATLIQEAASGALTACLNFDGDHVDVEICRRIVELAGADNLIVITDRVDGDQMAGRVLKRSAENSLLYQETNVVAAGTQGLERQQENMRRVGLSEVEIWKLTALTTNRVLGRLEPSGISIVRHTARSGNALWPDPPVLLASFPP